MKRQLFDIWKEAAAPGTVAAIFPFRVQMVNYVGSFGTQMQAESFVESIKKCRDQVEKSVFSRE